MAFFEHDIQKLLPQFESKLTKPWLIFLEGDLGSGKTTWTQELIGALGGNSAEVKSPTFLKLLTHDISGFGQVLHLDAYRMDEMEDFLKLGMDSYDRVAALVIEWPSIFMQFIATYPEYKSVLGLKNYVTLNFEIRSDQPSRLCQVQWKTL